MDATDVVCGRVAPDEVRAGMIKFKDRLSLDEQQRMVAIRANSSEYKKSFEYAAKVLRAADPSSEVGYKVCLNQAIKVGNMPRK